MNRNGGRLHIPIRLVLLGALLLVGLASRSEAEPDKAARIKSACLLNFIKFTRWPEKAFEAEDSPIVIGVVGRDPLGEALPKTLRGWKVRGRALEVRRYPLDEHRGEGHQRDESYDGATRQRLRDALADCHVLYLSESERHHARSILEELAPDTALTVGDRRPFIDRGAMLALDILRNRVVFYANANAIDAAPLTVSSKVLELAESVQGAD